MTALHAILPISNGCPLLRSHRRAAFLAAALGILLRAGVLSQATEVLVVHKVSRARGLLSATLGYAAESPLNIFSAREDLLELVKLSATRSILAIVSPAKELSSGAGRTSTLQVGIGALSSVMPMA